MVFSSPTFLFLFLPSVVWTCLALRRSVRAQNAVLLAASILFYAWGEGAYVALILGSIAINYLLGRVIGAAAATPRRVWLGVGVTLNVGLLVAFKYVGFIVQRINMTAMTELIEPPDIHLPVGISFFTFQAISYLVDVHRGEVEAQRSPFKVALFISLFPQLLAGPIVRYKDIAAQIDQRETTADSFGRGAARFVVGLAKKVLLADNLAVWVQQAFDDTDPPTAALAWLGALAFTGQIYLDFSGYSDMAIGLGRMFGFRIAENFDEPYRARSVTEFWRRWHISLSTWFRDYLYIPLGGNRISSSRTYLNLWLVFLLCGLWHGAADTFVFWGIYHGLFLVLERGPFGRKALAAAPRPLRHVYLMLVVIVGWVIFRAPDANVATSFLQAMLGLVDGGRTPEGLDRFAWLLMGASLLVCVPKPTLGEARPGALGWVRGVAVPAALLLLTMLSVSATTFRPFLYFRF